MARGQAIAPISIETKTIQKVRLRILPFVFLLYVVSYLDRINIGFAALTMNKELDITSQQFGLLAGIFFFGYFLFEIPSNLLLHKIGARIWIARILITWGAVAMLTGFVHTVRQLYVARFLLGLAEAGYFPGIILYLTYWFRQREEQQRQATQPISAIRALANVRVWHLACIGFTLNIAMYTLSFWLPQLVKSLSSGYSNSVVGLLVMIPYLVGLLAMVLVSRSSDRKMERKYHAAIPAIIAGIAFWSLSATHSTLSTIVFFCFAALGIYSVYGPLYSLPGEFLSGFAAASGIALVSSVANLGGFVGPYAIGLIGQRTGNLYSGLAFMGVSLFVSATLALLLPRWGHQVRANR